MKHIQFLSALILFAGFATSCSETNEQPTKTDSDKHERKESFEERARREVVHYLAIPTSEKYTMKIYREYINADTLLDAIITVNRLEYAMNEAIKTGREAKAAELGFTGNYNYMFYYDAAIDRISNPIFIPSSPGRPADIEFTSICAPTRKDVVVNYRIRNSGWKSYYSVFNDHDLMKVFEWKSFDAIGTKTPEVVLHSYESNPEQISMDIAIRESSINGYTPNIPNIYTYVPDISKKGKILFKFFLDPVAKKFRLYPDYVKNLPLLQE
jgi:hypothetical protein